MKARYQQFTLLGDQMSFDQLGLELPPHSHYNMAVDGAEPNDVTVTENAIIVHAAEPFTEDITHEDFSHDRHSDLIALAGAEADGVRPVPDRRAAEILDEHATWVETDGDALTYTEEATGGDPETLPSFIHVYEYIPIESPPTSADEYEALLDRHLDSEESVTL